MSKWHDVNGIRIFHGDVLDGLRDMDDKSVHCCVTSPPYFGLRDYGHEDQIGLEDTPDEFVAKLVEVFREVRRVLRDDGTLWLNIGDSYANNGSGGQGATGGRDKSTLASPMPPVGSTPVNKKVPNGLKAKDLIGIPWMLAFALRADGWYLRQDIIWSKPNPMPESVTDRCTKSHEYIFLLSKSPRYYFDHEAIKDPAVKGPQRMQASKEAVRAKGAGPMARGEEGFNHQFADPDRVWGTDGLRNKRDVWTVGTKPFKGAHFATFNPELIAPCILAGCPVGGTVLDPFMGSGTTAITAYELGRNAVGCELNGEYLHDICLPRIQKHTKQQRLIA